MLPTPNQELPRPERITPQPGSGEYVVPYPEQLEQAAPGERIAQAASAVAQASGTAVVMPPVLQAQPMPVQSPNPSQSGAPAIADDVDVIEKEWVEKAKDIVAKTKTDPHQQSIELTKFKHEYMKKRYDKEIKLPDDRVV